MEHEESFAACGLLSLNVPSLVAFKDQALTSACVPIGNLEWQLKLCKGNANDKQSEKQQYSIYANCNEMCMEHFWFCSAKFTLYSKQAGEEQMAMISSTGPMNAYYGNSQLLIGSIDASKTHPILLIVEVQIVHVQPKMFALNTNIQVRMANGTSRNVAVNKEGLAVISTYFQNLFFTQQTKEFVIREDDNSAFDIDTFRLMIYGALSLNWMVPELLLLDMLKEGSRILDTLKLAYKYDIRPLIENCEEQLILNPKIYPPNVEMLQLAEHMNLAQLRDHCLANLNIADSMENNEAGCTDEDANSSSVLEKIAMENSGNILKQIERTLEQTAGGGDPDPPTRIKIPNSEQMKAKWEHKWKSKKGRRNNAEQKQILEDEYRTDKYADGQQLRLTEIIAKTGLTDKQIKNWFRTQRYKEKKQCIRPQEEGMPLNHECISQESSSTSTSTSTYEKRWTFWSTSIAAAEHLAEEGKYWVQNHPLDCLLQPTNNEEATMNLAGELTNSSASAAASAAFGQNLAIQNALPDEAEDCSLSTSTDTASMEVEVEVDTDIYSLEENNKKDNDHGHHNGACSSSVFSSQIPGSSSFCPPPPPPSVDQHPTAAKLTKEFCRFFNRFVWAINSGEFKMDVTIDLFIRLESTRELLSPNPNGQEMQEIKQNLRQIGTQMLKNAKRA